MALDQQGEYGERLGAQRHFLDGAAGKSKGTTADRG
jgi:hypothetical protein